MVENLYPVLGDDREQAGFNFGLQQTIDGYGRHEVIIDHHEHGIAVHDMAESRTWLRCSASTRRACGSFSNRTSG
jgi:galactose-1-phosphate uridylyltransferase